MIEPGSVERVPLKVVPIFIDDPVVDEAAEPVEIPDATPQPPRRKTPLLGALAVATAVTAGVIHVVAIVQATGGDYLLATALAYASTVIAVIAVAVAVVAIVLHRGRRLGVIAAVVGLIANPFVLLTLFNVLGTPTT